MKLKKIPYYLLVLLLTAGPSIVIGFLSFGGMFALWAFLPVAIGALVLSMAYEAEIYSQNIKNALNKLFFKHNYLKQEFANRFLLDHFPDLTADDCPQFFKDYKALEEDLHHFGDKPLLKEDAAKKKLAQKALKDAEKFFAHQLFLSPTGKESGYQQELQQWLLDKNKEQAISQLESRRYQFHWVKLFSVISGILMGIGTVYLLLEGFAAIPLLAAIPLSLLPVIIIPLAINAGIAYALLIYNATTSMIHNDTLRRWYFQIRDDFRSGITLPKLAMALLSVVLVGLAVALTLCTAGTWWTVGNPVVKALSNNPSSLFTWISRIHGFVMGVVNPMINGASALIFNLENTHETFTIIRDIAIPDDKKAHHHHHHHKSAWSKLRERENILQLLNPARIFLALTITPLRIIMFLGHLISIGVTADRVPGISAIASAILGIISEGFEDLHYVYDHHHAHSIEESRKERLSSASGHDHSTDVPTIVLKIAFSPIYLLATLWAWSTSQFNEKPLSFKHAFFTQTGLKTASEKPLEDHHSSATIDWKKEQLIFVIEREKQKLLDNPFLNIDVTTNKHKGLTELQKQLQNAATPEDCKTIIDQNSNDQPCYRQHSFFAIGKTRTEECLDGLAQRAGVA